MKTLQRCSRLGQQRRANNGDVPLPEGPWTTNRCGVISSESALLDTAPAYKATRERLLRIG